MKSILATLISIFIIGLIISGCVSEELNSARLYLQQKNWEKAEEYLLKAMVVEPDNPEIPYRLGNAIYAKDEKWDEMNEMFSLAMSIDPDRVILQGATVRTYVEQAMEKYWTVVYNNAVASFNEYRKLGKDEGQTSLDQAISQLHIAISINPNNSRTYATLSTCYFEKGDEKSSVSMIQKAVEKSPEDFDANFTAGQILGNYNRFEEAISYLIKAVELKPNDVKLLRFLADIYYEIGEKEKSIEIYQTAIKSESNKKVKADLYYNLGVLNMQLNNYDAADLAFEEAYFLNEEDFEALLGMATLYEQLGDKYFNGTEEDIEKDYVEAHRWYRKARAKLRDLKNLDVDNRSTYKKALKLIDYKMNITAENLE